ncbi:hypothetical protein [Ruegeria sp. HKCCA5463]|uniref:hypothetical protein n=1 Tax=Ruegeria sp. HKCCA5463 TaxID=2682994 RepID=UPI0014887311|nr:hypothetical protein [Ruegeria sp. HKCCA5463]
MFNPIGYVSLYEIASEYRSANVSWDDFANQIGQVGSVAIYSPGEQPVQVSLDLLSMIQWGERMEFAFIDAGSGVVSLAKIRDAAKGMEPELFVGVAILFRLDTANLTGHQISLDFAQKLEPFEGQQIIVSDIEADRIRVALKNLSPKPAKRFATTAERDAAYNTLLDSFPGRKPTQKQREEWRKAHGITRDKERQLWDAYKPDDGSRPGVKSKRG